MKSINIAVPFRTMSDGRRYLTDEQLAENADLAAFVERFRGCFDYNPWCHHWTYIDPRRKEPT